MWKCPKCKREFIKNKQNHSCVVFPIENHFKGKEEIGKPIFDTLIEAINKKIGPVKVESLPCCIHLISSGAFGGVWIQKDKIKIDFRLEHKIKSPRIQKQFKASANKFMNYLEIKEKSEVDDELIGWIREAYNLAK